MLCGLAYGEVLPPDEANVSWWMKTSQYPCVISNNPVGRSDNVMKHSKVALCSLCALLYRSYSYVRNIQVTGPVGNSSYQAGKPVTLSVRGIVQLENEICFLIIKKCQQMMLTGVVERYWHIRGLISPGLPQGVLFTQILYNSLCRLCALSDISASLTRNMKMKTTRISIGCHSIRTVLVVRWHHIRAIALR